MEIAVAVTAIGIIVFLAHLFAAFFEQSRVPDVLPLVIIGLFIGPISGLASIQHFGEVGPVFSNLTLVIILFESGLNMKLTALRKALAPAAILGVLGYILSVVVVVITSKFLFHLPDISALILGTILGGTAASVAVPLLKGLNLQERTKTALMLESVLGNVLAIVITLALMKAVEADRLQPIAVMGEVSASFTMACVIGAIFGYVWSSLLVRTRTLAHTKFTTPATVCISYGMAEIFGFSGMLSALAFGIVMGNAERLPHSKLSSSTWLRPMSVNDDERALFAELVFLLKTFFFVYLGISIQFIGMDLVYAGSIIVLWLFISRPLVVRLALKRAKTTKGDATISSIMIPRGLAAAVLGSIAASKGIEDGIILQNVSYSVVVISIAATALFSFLCERRLLTQPYRFIFTGYKEDPDPTPPDEEDDEDIDNVEEGLAVFHYVKDYHHHEKPQKSSKKAGPKASKVSTSGKKQDSTKSTAPAKESSEKSKQEEISKEPDKSKTKKKPAKPKQQEASKKKKATKITAEKPKAEANQKSTDDGASDSSGDNAEEISDKLKEKIENAGKAASFEEQTITTPTVSLSHSVGPGKDGTADIMTVHPESEESNGDSEASEDDAVSEEESDKVES